MVATVGPPASGKSTVAVLLAQLISGHPSLPGGALVVVVDPDEIRGVLTPSSEFRPDLEPEVRRRARALALENLESGNVVVFDDMNYYRSARHDLLEIAEQASVRLFFVQLETSLEQCLRWNAKRGKPVPDDVVREVFAKFDPPDRYAWERPVLRLKLPLPAAQVRDALVEAVAIMLELAAGPPGRDDSVAGGSVTRSSGGDSVERVDRATRRVVSKLVEIARATGRDESSLREALARVAAARKAVLADARHLQEGDLEATVDRFELEARGLMGLKKGKGEKMKRGFTARPS
ncbi:MAG: hypothetical protein Kow0069_20280 [Promethearchaeota archaeon]